KTPITQRLQWHGKTLAWIDAELFLEIIAAHAAQLELQNKFTNQPFVVIGCERAEDGQFALVNLRHVMFKIMMILIMCAAEMTEARDAEGEQIGAGPKFVAIDEFCFPLHRWHGRLARPGRRPADRNTGTRICCQPR